MIRQLSFDLPVRTALGREDFFVSPANAFPVAMIENWQNWPARKLVLTGPEGSGKTHLTHVWAARSGARIISAKSLPEHDIPSLCTAPVAIEDVQSIAGDRVAEEALFHLHNLALAEGHPLLFTATRAPNLWGIALPDLRSRMEGTPVATLEEPDDTLLAAVIMKLFSDRQIVPTADTIPYLVSRIDRSFATARAMVARIDQTGLDQGRAINRKLASEILADFA